MAPGPSAPAEATVLVAAGRADWEPDVLAGLAGARIVVLRRCVDVVDLLATASAGTADVAVVAADLDGVDAESLRGLRRSGVGVVGVGGSTGDRERLTLLGVPTVVDAAAVVDAVRAVMRHARGPTPAGGRSEARGPELVPDDAGGPPAGRVVAVLGATGAPGRSTVAAALAAERSLSRRVVLCDVDPYAGSLAQGFGVLDEASGLLAAARAVNEGALDAAGLTSLMRTVAPGLDLLTGLPRADRWVEIRPGVVESVAGVASGFADVVLDGGFGLPPPDPTSAFGATPARINAESLEVADRLLVIGSAEPVALARLARALVELHEAAAVAPVTVVVNRMRANLGWRNRDIVAMVNEVAPGATVSFWPYERAALDRASLRGVPLTELGDTPLRECARALADELFAPAPV